MFVRFKRLKVQDTDFYNRLPYSTWEKILVT